MSNTLSAPEFVASVTAMELSPAAQAILDTLDAEQSARLAKASSVRRAQASAARVQANRANAQKSTGPRTAAGKSKASRNSTRHGLLSTSPGAPLTAETLPGEQEHYQSILTALTVDLSPSSFLEIALVERLASLQLRLQRIPRIEAGLFAKSIDSAFRYNPDYEDVNPDAPPTDRLLADAYAGSSRQLNLLTFYEARLSRDFHRMLQQLRQLQNSRLSAPRATPVTVCDTTSAPAMPSPEALPKVDKRSQTHGQPLEKLPVEPAPPRAENRVSVTTTSQLQPEETALSITESRAQSEKPAGTSSQLCSR